MLQLLRSGPLTLRFESEAQMRTVSKTYVKLFIMLAPRGITCLLISFQHLLKPASWHQETIF